MMEFTEIPEDMAKKKTERLRYQRCVNCKELYVMNITPERKETEYKFCPFCISKPDSLPSYPTSA